MALQELINQIVDVQIRNVTSNTYSRDLNTIMILSKHDVFTHPEIYRVYQDANSLLEDGFDLDSYAYNAVRLIFSQEITPTKVVVGRVPTSATDEEGYIAAFNQMLMIPEGWLWMISDLRKTVVQVTLAGLVEASDKMYCAATRSLAALDPLSDIDLASRINALGYKNTMCWFDGLPEEQGGGGGTGGSGGSGNGGGGEGGGSPDPDDPPEAGAGGSWDSDYSPEAGGGGDWD